MSINFYRIMKGILWYLVKPKDEEMYQRLGESQRKRRQKPDFKFYQLPKLFFVSSAVII